MPGSGLLNLGTPQSGEVVTAHVCRDTGCEKECHALSRQLHKVRGLRRYRHASRAELSTDLCHKLALTELRAESLAKAGP